MITLTFTQEQMAHIAMGINEIPHKFAVPLIQTINQQMEAAKKAEQRSSVDFKPDPSEPQGD